MKNIVRLSDYRERHTAPRETAPSDPGPHYYCERCESDRFRLFTSGVIRCAHCGVQMGNISVGA